MHIMSHLRSLMPNALTAFPLFLQNFWEASVSKAWSPSVLASLRASDASVLEKDTQDQWLAERGSAMLRAKASFLRQD